MKNLPALCLALALTFLARPAAAQNPATDPVGLLSVQGVLQDNGVPVNGFMDWCFDIYLTPTGGTSVAHDTNMTPVAVSNGLANVLYNLGPLVAKGINPTQDLYLQMDVRPAGSSNAFTVLGPRQRIVPSLFASMAVRAEEARRLIEPLPASLMPSSISTMTFTGRPTFAATTGAPFTVASSAVVAGLDADLLDGYDSSAFWKLAGNAGTTAGTDFLGTLDNQPLDLKVNSQRALRLEPYLTVAPNLIAGSSANAVVGTEGASILGGHLNTINAGGLFSVIGGGAENLIDINAENSVLSGGRRNSILANAKRSTIGGGATNAIKTYTDFAVIAGGVNNVIADDTDWATISGGRTNVILNGSAESTIAGGGYHYIANGCEASTISGGFSNRLTQAETTIGGGKMNTINSGQGTIGGGLQNKIEATANYSTIGGGTLNLVNPNSPGATVGGGVQNKVDQASPYGVVSGGYSNIVGRTSGAIGGGERNQVLALGGTVAGGILNQVALDAKASTIGGGAGNYVDQYTTNAVIAGGFANVIHSNANYSTIGGGSGNHIATNKPYATIPGGLEARAFNYGQVAHASGGFSGVEGTAQQSFYVVRATTTNTDSAELFLDGVGRRISVPANSTWTYDVLVAARNSMPGSAGWHIRGTVGYNPLGELVTIGTPIVDEWGGGLSASAEVVADNANKALTVVVRWLGGIQPVRWVATVRAVEVVF